MTTNRINLSSEQIIEYFKKIKTGDIDARRFMIENNIPLVLLTIKRFLNSEVEIEDLISVGTIGLINAVDNYDINRNIKFSTYALRCIENEIKGYLKKNQKNLNTISIDSDTINFKDEEFRLIDILQDENADIEKSYIDDEVTLIIYQILNTLNERDRKIIELYYGFNMERVYTQEEISKIMNLSQSHVGRLIKKTLHKIKTSPKSRELVLTLYN